MSYRGSLGAIETRQITTGAPLELRRGGTRIDQTALRHALNSRGPQQAVAMARLQAGAAFRQSERSTSLIVPDYCQNVWRDRYVQPGPEVKPGEAYVAAYIQTAFDGRESVPDKYLDLFVYDQKKGSPWKSPLPFRLPVAAEGASPLTAGPALVRWVEAYLPDNYSLDYFAAGFVPEKIETRSGGASRSRGTVWFAFSLDRAISTTLAGRLANRLLDAADDVLQRPLPDGARVLGGRRKAEKFGAALDNLELKPWEQMVAPGTGVKSFEASELHTGSVSPTTQDADLMAAVYNSAIGPAAFGAALKVTLSWDKLFKPVGDAKKQIEQASTAAREAWAAVQAGIGALTQATETAIQQASGLPQPTDGQVVLDRVGLDLEILRRKVASGSSSAPSVVELAGKLQTEILPTIRRTIRQTTDQAAASDQNASALMADYYACAAYKQAEPYFQRVQASLTEALTTAVGPAQALVQNQTQVQEYLTQLGDLIGKVSRAKANLGVPFLSQTGWLGLPKMVWIGVGGVAAIGGLFVVRRVIRKKPVTANRRRSRGNR